MNTAERALELAAIFDGRGSNEGVHGNIEEMGWYYDAADLLRWAAEVMKAETVAAVEDGDLFLYGHWADVVRSISSDCELIIKPTSPNLVGVNTPTIGDNNG